jgi:hypothetical protein
MGKKNRHCISHGEVINDTLDGVSIHPVTTKIQASFLTQLSERKETAQAFHHEANGDVKTVTESIHTLTVNHYSQSLMAGDDGRKLRTDQQHCSYFTTLT